MEEIRAYSEGLGFRKMIRQENKRKIGKINSALALKMVKKKERGKLDDCKTL